MTGGLKKACFFLTRRWSEKVSAGDEILVTLYIDKKQRLCATTKGIYHMLSTDSPYKKDDMVSGRVYDFSDNFGTFIAVDDKYSAKIPVFLRPLLLLRLFWRLSPAPSAYITCKGRKFSPFLAKMKFQGAQNNMIQFSSTNNPSDFSRILINEHN